MDTDDKGYPSSADAKMQLYCGIQSILIEEGIGSLHHMLPTFMSGP